LKTHEMRGCELANQYGGNYPRYIFRPGSCFISFFSKYGHDRTRKSLHRRVLICIIVETCLASGFAEAVSGSGNVAYV